VTQSHFAGPYFNDTPPASWNWINALAEPGWAIAYNLVPPALLNALRDEAKTLHAEDKLSLAGIGRAEDLARDKSIRRDKTHWLSHNSAVQSAYLDLMEELRLILNQSLILGLFEYEAHYAAYEEGAYYKRHLDAFKGAKNRILSTVLYLNEEWRPEDGGQLAIYKDDAAIDPVELIQPEGGTLVVFLSEDIPHEVLPALKDRYSIAGWFRLNDRAIAPVLQAPALPLPELPEG
jgi:SM-20-related protein